MDVSEEMIIRELKKNNRHKMGLIVFTLLTPILVYSLLSMEVLYR